MSQLLQPVAAARLLHFPPAPIRHARRRLTMLSVPSPPRETTLASANASVIGSDENVVAAIFSEGMSVLLRALDYAIDLGRSRWEFAVELAELQRLGLSTADCRWLSCKGWVEIAREQSSAPGSPRRFQHDLHLSLTRRSCLVLTDLGATEVRKHFAVQLQKAQTVDANYQRGHGLSLAPRWDRERHELRVAGQLVKQFRLPSPNQEKVLNALQEENWPVRIDDPLPPNKKLDAKQRLHDTIKNLNRHQKKPLIRFMGDGTGQGVRWEIRAEQL